MLKKEYRSKAQCHEIIPTTNQTVVLNPNHPVKNKTGRTKRRQKKQAKTKIQKPKKLPYEETEQKALEIGEFAWKMNLFKTKRGFWRLRRNLIQLIKSQSP